MLELKAFTGCCRCETAGTQTYSMYFKCPPTKQMRYPVKAYHRLVWSIHTRTPSHGESFHSHTLGQVARLVHVAPSGHGDLIGQELQRNSVQERVYIGVFRPGN